MLDAITSNEDPQPVADDMSDGYIADRLYWDSKEPLAAMWDTSQESSTEQFRIPPCTPTVPDSPEANFDCGSTPESQATSTVVPTLDANAIPHSFTISVVTHNNHDIKMVDLGQLPTLDINYFIHFPAKNVLKILHDFINFHSISNKLIFPITVNNFQIWTAISFIFRLKKFKKYYAIYLSPTIMFTKPDI